MWKSCRVTWWREAREGAIFATDNSPCLGQKPQENVKGGVEGGTTKLYGDDKRGQERWFLGEKQELYTTWILFLQQSWPSLRHNQGLSSQFPKINNSDDNNIINKLNASKDDIARRPVSAGLGFFNEHENLQSRDLKLSIYPEDMWSGLLLASCYKILEGSSQPSKESSFI